MTSSNRQLVNHLPPGHAFFAYQQPFLQDQLQQQQDVEDEYDDEPTEALDLRIRKLDHSINNHSATPNVLASTSRSSRHSPEAGEVAGNSDCWLPRPLSVSPPPLLAAQRPPSIPTTSPPPLLSYGSGGAADRTTTNTTSSEYDLPWPPNERSQAQPSSTRILFSGLENHPHRTTSSSDGVSPPRSSRPFRFRPSDALRQVEAAFNSIRNTTDEHQQQNVDQLHHQPISVNNTNNGLNAGLLPSSQQQAENKWPTVSNYRNHPSFIKAQQLDRQQQYSSNDSSPISSGSHGKSDLRGHGGGGGYRTNNSNACPPLMMRPDKRRLHNGGGGMKVKTSFLSHVRQQNHLPPPRLQPQPGISKMKMHHQFNSIKSRPVELDRRHDPHIPSAFDGELHRHHPRFRHGHHGGGDGLNTHHARIQRPHYERVPPLKIHQHSPPTSPFQPQSNHPPNTGSYQSMQSQTTSRNPSSRIIPPSLPVPVVHSSHPESSNPYNDLRHNQFLVKLQQQQKQQELAAVASKFEAFSDEMEISRLSPKSQPQSSPPPLEPLSPGHFSASPLISGNNQSIGNSAAGAEIETTMSVGGLAQKGRRGRPRKNAIKIPLPPLYVFIRNLLHNRSYNPRVVSWVSEAQGIFKVNSTSDFARTWGLMKSNRNEEMTYEKMSRAMRYHYGSEKQGRKGHLAMVKEKRLVYRFGELAINWRQEEVQPLLGCQSHDLCRNGMCLWRKE